MDLQVVLRQGKCIFIASQDSVGASISTVVQAVRIAANGIRMPASGAAQILELAPAAEDRPQHVDEAQKIAPEDEERSQ